MSLSFNLSLPMAKEAKSEDCLRPEDAARIFSDLSGLAQEAFCILTLDVKFKVIDRHLITLGILDQCIVHPRELFRPAITDGASAIVLIHNHPSGDPTPSREDIRLTRSMVEAGKLLQIDVYDHVIIGRKSERVFQNFCSLRESGLCQF